MTAAPVGVIASPTPAPMGLKAGPPAAGAETGDIGGAGGEDAGALAGGGGSGAILGGAGAGARLGDEAGACAVAAAANRARSATMTAARRAAIISFLSMCVVVAAGVRRLMLCGAPVRERWGIAGSLVDEERGRDRRWSNCEGWAEAFIAEAVMGFEFFWARLLAVGL
ncbi:hypothetical protein HU200_023623 [Digitaria exilis]|uniref:Uncharacterized protein n=1 Tax=Digitaria exilis TaxID=1010633 RepID=A0A835EXH9_9POAL|nr:hypothetical protein HU200_023623 [Digitaria exilis]